MVVRRRNSPHRIDEIVSQEKINRERVRREGTVERYERSENEEEEQTEERKE